MHPYCFVANLTRHSLVPDSGDDTDSGGVDFGEGDIIVGGTTFFTG